MAVGLGKRIAIAELFKAGKSQKEICKNLKVNKMLIWKTLKRYKESENVQNRPEQGRPRSPSTSRTALSWSERKSGESEEIHSENGKGGKCFVWGHVYGSS